MHFKRLISAATPALLFFLFLSLSAHAQDERTYVTKNGDGLDNIARGFCNTSSDEIYGRNVRVIGRDRNRLNPNVSLEVKNYCNIRILDATRSAESPLNLTVKGTAQLSSVIWGETVSTNAIEIWVYATDSNGNRISQPVRTDQPFPGAGNSQAWSARLTMQTAPGPGGRVVAEGRNGFVTVRTEFPIPLGEAPTQVSISHPLHGQVLPTRFEVSGTVQGIELREISVLAVDTSKNLLDAASAPVQMIGSSAGRRGIWSVEMDVDRMTTGEIQVKVPGTTIYMTRTVIFAGAGENPGLPTSAINRFSVDRQQINLGECVSFVWDIRNAQAVYLYREGQMLPKNNGNQYSAPFADCPNHSSTYRLRVAGTDGRTEDRTMNIWVGERQIGGPGPVIAGFDANPKTVNVNKPCTTLIWTINEPGNTRMTLSRNNFVVAWPVNATQHMDCVPASEMGKDIVYSLRLDSEFSGWTLRTVRVISGR